MTLREFLNHTNQTVLQFATKVGCSHGGMAKLACGERMPRSDMMRRIAVASGFLVMPNDWCPDLVEQAANHGKDNAS